MLMYISFIVFTFVLRIGLEVPSVSKLSVSKLFEIIFSSFFWPVHLAIVVGLIINRVYEYHSEEKED